MINAQAEIATVVKMPSPQLHEFGINKSLNEAEGVLLLRSKINALVKFMGGDWDTEMRVEAAKLAYQEANWMTVAEVKLFFSRAMCGKYESHKNFTPIIFMQFLNGYINETLATRGAVNSYAWRDNKIPDELFQLPVNPATGQPGVQVDPAVMKKMLSTIAENWKNLEHLEREQEERDRKAKWQALKNQRDQQIVDLVERDAAQGIAPDKYMTKKYFEALARLAGKEL